jgi:hypothetical protein
MTRDEILATLSGHRSEFVRDFAVRSLALFGSAARDESHAGSDIDLLVEFDAPTTFERYFGLKDRLESLLGRPVDLVTAQGLKPRARAQVERDLLHVA